MKRMALLLLVLAIATGDAAKSPVLTTAPDDLADSSNLLDNWLSLTHGKAPNKKEDEWTKEEVAEAAEVASLKAEVAYEEEQLRQSANEMKKAKSEALAAAASAKAKLTESEQRAFEEQAAAGKKKTDVPVELAEADRAKKAAIMKAAQAAENEVKKVDAAKKAPAALKSEEAKKAEGAKKMAAEKAEAAKEADEANKAEDAKKAAAAAAEKAEVARKLHYVAKAAQEARKAEASAEAALKAEEANWAEDAKNAAAATAEKAEAAKKAEEAKKAEDAKKAAEAAEKAEAAKEAEEAKKAAAAAAEKAEAAKEAEEAKKAAAATAERAEIAKKAEEAKKAKAENAEKATQAAKKANKIAEAALKAKKAEDAEMAAEAAEKAEAAKKAEEAKKTKDAKKAAEKAEAVRKFEEQAAKKAEQIRKAKAEALAPKKVAVKSHGTEEPLSPKKVAVKSHGDQQVSNYGNPKCQCIGFSGVEGNRLVMLGGKFVEFPGDLGSSCKAWDDGIHPACRAGTKPGKGKDWCANQWCFVDPRKCDVQVLPEMSTYMPTARHQKMPLFWSYSTCNKKQPSVEVAGPLGLQKCSCIGFDNAPGIMKLQIGDASVTYPAETGGSCGAWDMSNNPLCAVKEAHRPDFCNKKWCFVDPCSCDMGTPPKVSDALFDASYAGKKVYYSYETCRELDVYTSGFNKMACVNAKSKDACSEKSWCSWTGSKCLGKELVDKAMCGAEGSKVADVETDAKEADAKEADAKEADAKEATTQKSSAQQQGMMGAMMAVLLVGCTFV